MTTAKKQMDDLNESVAELWESIIREFTPLTIYVIDWIMKIKTHIDEMCSKL